MFDITLITMGKLKEPFCISAASEYAKRLSAYCKSWYANNHRHGCWRTIYMVIVFLLQLSWWLPARGCVCW